MINYADYKFYSETYKGNLSENLFNSLIIKASREIDKNVNCDLTQEIVNDLSEIEQYKLKYTTCELCDFLNSNGDNTSNGKADSISIDGVSINKGKKSETELSKNKCSILSNLPDSLTRFL